MMFWKEFEDSLDTLRNRFGFNEYRGAQKEALMYLNQGENVLTIMPTGMGKSLIYQMVALADQGLVLVISPLIALMKDQVDHAKKIGIRAGFINSSLTMQQRQEAYQKLKAQHYQLLFVTPERFKKQEFLESLAQAKISLLAIDEAHCISQWGHDFRPDYTRIQEFRSFLGDPLTLALTATATLAVQDDIVKQLGVSSIQRLSYGVERPNLNLHCYEVHGIDEKIRTLLMLRNQINGPIIVYGALIQTLKKMSYELSRLGVAHCLYHGQLGDRDRRRNQDRFLKDQVDMIIATPAFGLGVNKPNVRSVIHVELPGSIEAYFQEVGRAGRDGKTADNFLLFDPDDISIQMDFIKWSNPDPGFVKHVYQLIKDYRDRILVEGLEFLRQKMNFYNSRDFRLETTINLLERWGAIEVLGEKNLRAIAEPESDYLNSELYAARFRKQNENLLKMVQLTRAGDDIKPQIYSYFGMHDESS